MPTTNVNYSCHIIVIEYFNQLYENYMMPLAIHSLGGIHTHTHSHTHTYTHTHTHTHCNSLILSVAHRYALVVSFLSDDTHSSSRWLSSLQVAWLRHSCKVTSTNEMLEAKEITPSILENVDYQHTLNTVSACNIFIYHIYPYRSSGVYFLQTIIDQAFIWALSTFYIGIYLL